MSSDDSNSIINKFNVVWEDLYQESFNGKTFLWYELIVDEKNNSSRISEYKLIARAPYSDESTYVELWYQTCGNGFKLYHNFRIGSIGNQPTKSILHEKSLEILKLYMDKIGR